MGLPIGVGPASAFGAVQGFGAPYMMMNWLQNHLLTALIAGGANLMRRLGSTCLFLQGVDERTAGKLLKTIALLLSFPCFEARGGLGNSDRSISGFPA